MKTKICILTAHPTLDRRVFYREAVSLRDFGYDVTVIGEGTGQVRVEEGIRLIPVERGAETLGLWRFTRGVRQAALAEPGVTMYHTDDYKMMPTAISIMKKTGKPMILDIHEMYPGALSDRLAPRGIGKGILRWFFEWYENRCAKRIKNVILVYNQDCDRFERLGCRVIHVDNYATKKDYPAEPVSEETWARRENTVVHVGVLARVRGSKTIVDLASRFKRESRPIRFLISELFYKPQQKADYESLLAAGDTDGVLERVPLMLANELAALLNRASVGLALLVPEGRLLHAMPTKLFEYMACSVPIVASRWSTTERLVEATGCGIVVKDNCDLDEYAEAILSILGDREMAKRMGEAGRQAFLNEFNWETQEPRMLKFYEDILCERRSDTEGG